MKKVKATVLIPQKYIKEWRETYRLYKYTDNQIATILAKDWIEADMFKIKYYNKRDAQELFPKANIN